MPRNTAYNIPKLVINGAEVDGTSTATFPVEDPFDESTLATLAMASSEDVDAAISAAADAYVTWSRMDPFARADILTKGAERIRARGEAIAQTITLENGKSIHESRLEVGFTANLFQWLAEEACHGGGRTVPSRLAGNRLSVQSEPVGPVACLTPWNFPAVTPARKLAAALAAGCSVVIKPAEETPATVVEIARCLAEAGLPDGVLNVLYGDPAAISEQLISAPAIRKVSFTGSVPVGKLLAGLAAQHMKRATMELGGHAPVVVFDDVDAADAGARSVAGKFRNAGQICTSPTRFYAHDAVFDSFVSAFVDGAQALRVGDGMDEDMQVGPLTNARRREAVEALINDAVEHGATLKCGGKSTKNSGFFFEPTILTDVPLEARIMHEEPFGPVAVVNRWSRYDDVVEECNRTPYGLAAYAFTQSTTNADKIARDLESGMVGINNFVVSQPEIPFSGVKDSGYGYEGGREGLEAFQVHKAVSHQLL